jgi:hypothetical protein
MECFIPSKSESVEIVNVNISDEHTIENNAQNRDVEIAVELVSVDDSQFTSCACPRL